MPRVTQKQRLVPLCDASVQCTSCASLQGFIETERALELPMVLSKKGLAHVQQTVGWLMAPQGGSWALQMDVAAGVLEGLRGVGSDCLACDQWPKNHCIAVHLLPPGLLNTGSCGPRPHLENYQLSTVQHQPRPFLLNKQCLISII
jgi:hypothetical protein